MNQDIGIADINAIAFHSEYDYTWITVTYYDGSDPKDIEIEDQDYVAQIFARATKELVPEVPLNIAMAKAFVGWNKDNGSPYS